MDPVDALTEIAFLLERDRAIRYKSKAFRTAGDVVVGLDPAVLADPVRLKNTKGIGDTTYTVIRQALAGEVPEYLAKLRETSAIAATSELRAKLKGDLHAHSEWSDGTTSIELMVDSARRLGHEYLAITDHSPRLTIARGLSAERLAEQLEVVRGLSGDGIRVLTGIEVDINDDGTLDQTDELLGQLDVVVASVHSKLKSEPRTMTRRMIAAVENPHTDVLGHITGRLVEGARGTRPGATFDAKSVFEACAANGVAVEVNSRPERQDPPDDLIALALDAGCLFSIDSDAHAPGQLGLLDYGAERAEKNGIPPERIVTTYPVEQLLQWTARDR
ncbi:MAG TPA: PHP domain-containing protein [Pseudolysinimonas sp.]|nr:PHP domain-containing protein [Pseudolysinimonas sp.]